PILILLFFIALPAITFINSMKMPEATRKKKLKELFIKDHILQQENLEAVSAWFEQQYTASQRQKNWWKLHNLFETPPLGRDWTAGYTPTLDEYAEDLTHPTYQIAI